jgi:iron complex outermembrane receptor protein
VHKNVGAFTTLFLAIAAAMAVSAARAETPAAAPAQGSAQAEQNQAGTADPVSQKTKRANDAQNRAQTTQLGSVVVTATRREETLQKVPLPVSVLSYHDLERQHLQSLDEYAAHIPGLNAVSTGEGSTQLSIRGIASGSLQPSQSVGIYVDDTPYGSSSVFASGGGGVPDFDPADLERIEVLRGPQGTLYGAGSLGGVLRFITIKPDAQNFSGRLQVDANSISGGGSGFGMHGMVNVPLVPDKLAIRINVYDRKDPGYVDDAALGKKEVNESNVKGSRVSLMWTPTDKTSLRVTALAQNLNRQGDGAVGLDPATSKPLYGDLQQRHAALTSDAFVGQYRLYNATFKTDLGWSNLLISSSYSTLAASISGDDTGLLYLGPQGNGRLYGTLQHDRVHETKATQEIRLESPKSQTLEWLGGVFFTDETGDHPQHIYASDYLTGAELASPFGVAIGDDTQPSTYTAYAAYGNVTWHVTDRFDLEAGLRYSHDKQHYIESGSGLLFGSATPVVLVNKASADSTTTYSLTPKFNINDNTMVYLRVASGFIPGGPNVVPVGTAGVPTTFSPTQLTDYELGLKSTVWDDRLTVDISAYYIDWTKIPLVTSLNNFSFLTSSGQAKSQGLEASVAFVPTHGLTLSANASFNDAVLTKDAPPPSNGVKGDRMPYAPRVTIGLNGDYDFAVGGGWNGYVGAGYAYVGDRESDFTFNGRPRYSVPGYYTVNLRAGAIYGPWTISLYAKNLTDQRGIVQGGGNGTLNPVTAKVEAAAYIVTPRTIGISVSRDF